MIEHGPDHTGGIGTAFQPEGVTTVAEELADQRKRLSSITSTTLEGMIYDLTRLFREGKLEAAGEFDPAIPAANGLPVLADILPDILQLAMRAPGIFMSPEVQAELERTGNIKNQALEVGLIGIMFRIQDLREKSGVDTFADLIDYYAMQGGVFANQQDENTTLALAIDRNPEIMDELDRQVGTNPHLNVIAPKDPQVEKTDQLLAEKAKEHDTAAFGALYERYRPKILNYLRNKFGASPEDAEDITQEAFIKAWNGIQNFDGKLFRAWIYTIATNVWTDRIRRERIRPYLERRSIAQNEVLARGVTDDFSGDVVNQLVRVQNDRKVHEAMNNLNPRQVQMLILRHFKELSYDEIASYLDTTVPVVKARLYRARKNFREKIERDGFTREE